MRHSSSMNIDAWVLDAIRMNQTKTLAKGTNNTHLALASGDDSVARNELGHHSTSGLNTESERADINEEDVLRRLVTREDTTLDRCTISDSLIRVNALGGLLATEELLEELLNLGDTS